MGYFLFGAVAAVAVTGGVLWWQRRKNGSSSDEQEHVMLSFVALLKEPQHMESVILAPAAARAWKADLGDGNSEGEDGFVVGAAPTTMIKYQDRMMMVNSFDTPYVENPEEVAAEIGDLRLRELFARHQAWLSCDALGVESFDDEREVRRWYQLLGHLLSELVDENCLAIYLPQTQQLFANMDETLDKLRAADPLSALAEDAPVPVVPISEDDPRMKAAVEEAREKWPEFVAAFEERAGENFGVKAPVTVGENTEFIWLEVDALENGVIYGRLANEPIDLGKLKIGSRVRVPENELNDWAFSDFDGNSHGLFTVKVIAEAGSESPGDG